MRRHCTVSVCAHSDCTLSSATADCALAVWWHACAAPASCALARVSCVCPNAHKMTHIRVAIRDHRGLSPLGVGPRHAGVSVCCSILRYLQEESHIADFRTPRGVVGRRCRESQPADSHAEPDTRGGGAGRCGRSLGLGLVSPTSLELRGKLRSHPPRASFGPSTHAAVRTWSRCHARTKAASPAMPASV